MATTRTPGITIGDDGRLLIDKRHCGIRIIRRLGATTQEQAEQRLQIEMQHAELARIAKARPCFADCAVRYLAQCRERRSLEAIRIHVRLLLRYVGHLKPHQVHDATLAPLIADRIAAGASATTINRTLEVARTILNRAARSYRDDDGRPWLEATPPLLTMLPESRRSPYPLTWDEQDRLFPRLPAHLQPMALFAVNTGLRNDNVCGLEWSWEVVVPEIGRSVFIVPAAAFKSRRDQVVILNDAAWSIVQAQRGLHPVWVFPFRGHRVETMNNNGWQKARREVGLRRVRVHDLRHTFACRLRAAGVSEEDRCALLGHAEHSMSGHYASADIGRLLRQANLVLNRHETRTVLRVANGDAADADLWTTGPARVPQLHGRLGLVGPSH
jgi:integrase